MKVLTLNIVLLITALMPSDTKAQKKPISSIEWNIAGEIPGSNENKPIGLAGAISGVNNNVLLVAGGSNFPDKMPWLGGKKHYYNQIYIYEKGGANKLKLSPESFLLPNNLAYSAVFSAKKGLIVAGGENELGNSKKVLLLKWSPKKRYLSITNLPDFPFAVTNASLCVVGDLVYLAGGEVDGQTVDSFLALNLNTPNLGWKVLAKIPQITSHGVLLAPTTKGNGQLFLAGGRRKNASACSTIYNEVFAYDIAQNKWVSKQPLPYGVSAAAGVSYGKELLIFSGDTGETFNKVENLIFKIQQEKDSDRLKALNIEKERVLTGHPGFSTGVLVYNLSTNKWNLLNTLPAHPPVTTNAVLWGNQIYISGGEIRAGVRSATILSGKIK